MASASTWRIRWHFYFDILIFAVGNLIYCFEPIFLPISLVWTIGAWLIAFGPKQHHGLLFRLKTPPAPKSPYLLSLPVVMVAETPNAAWPSVNQLTASDRLAPTSTAT